jgi:hypothetical protein
MPRRLKKFALSYYVKKSRELALRVKPALVFACSRLVHARRAPYASAKQARFRAKPARFNG